MGAKMLHTCIRVANLEKSLEFYKEVLGLIETRRKDFPEHKFTLVYLSDKEDGYELEYDESKNHYIQGTWGYSDEFGNSKEVTMLLPNDEDVNKLKFEIENLNVGTTVNSVLLIEVAKQFESYVNGDISLEDSINKVVDNLDLYLSE